MEQSSFEQRYHRQLILPGFGPDAQQRLTAAKVLVIGAGGLGCPVLQYLVAAGIGHLAIADQDTVSLSNLQRQILYGESDLGQLKATVAKERLASLNSGVKLVSLPVHWTPADCVRYFPEYDIIVDATDNFATRYMINDAAVLLGKPVVYGSVSRYEGQVAVLNHLREDRSRSVNYRDLFPEMPQQHEVLTCAEAGVLGAVTGVIGSLQALEVIKVITQTGKPLTDALLTYNGLTQELFRVELQALESSGSTLPGTIEIFLATDYHQLGDQSIPEVSWEALQSRLNEVLLVDVRNLEESPRLSKLISDKGGMLKEIPLDVLSDRIEECTGVEVVFVCQSGVRSQQAVRFLRKYDPSLKASSVKGGVNAFVETKSAEYGR
jgi:adenylyltransferase/sulfurtransferase